MDLSDPTTFARVYDEHRRGVYGAALPRSSATPRRPRTSSQDVFLRVWRNPGKFDARRGELGSYLRLMARSRALDLWREGQAAGRAERPPEGRRRPATSRAPTTSPTASRRARRATAPTVRDALRALPDAAARGARARLLGRADRRPDRRPRRRPARHGQEPHPPRPGASCAPSSAPRCARRAGAGRRRRSSVARPMPVRGPPHDDVVAGCSTRRLAWLGAGVDWFDAHTHIGHNDPDGLRGRRRRSSSPRSTTPASSGRCVFAMHEPGGYRARQRRGARRRARRPAGASSALGAGRPQRTTDARRRGARACLDGGRARHQAAPAHRRLRAAAPGRRARSSRSPPSARRPCSSTPGAGSRTSARRSLDARAPPPGRAARSSPTRGSATSGCSRRAAAELPNLLFDTAWWQVARPARAVRDRPARPDPLRAATCPTAPPRFASRCSLRCARAVGLDARAGARAIAGGAARARPRGRGPARPRPGAGDRARSAARDLGARARRRATSTAAVQMTFRGGDPTEALALARLACQAPATEHRVLAAVERCIARASSAAPRRRDGPLARRRWRRSPAPGAGRLTPAPAATAVAV